MGNELEALAVRCEGASAWQPIATVPRDGTIILALEVHDNPKFRPCVYEGRYQKASQLSCLLSHEENPRFHNLSANRWSYPTHWMPLPDPPARALTPRDQGE